MSHILLLEDDDRLRAEMVSLLRDHGHAVQAVRSIAEAGTAIQTHALADLWLLDIRVSDGTGIELARQKPDHVALLFVSGAASISETVEGLRLGAFDVIEKPFTPERLIVAVRNALERTRLERKIEELSGTAGASLGIVGRSRSIEELRSTISRVASTDARVLILGESGSGKELVAAALHRTSRRSLRPFVRLNCAAIPPTLIESELFGHARGAFTDARSTRRGLFEEADGGTLLLDEIGDMDLALQARLLRVLEDGRVRRVGESTDRPVDVRVLASTHRDLQAMTAAGEFREDLYFRLSAVPLHVPPLRERGDDIILLFDVFLREACARNGRPPLERLAEFDDALRHYSWPGNVRQLRNVAERLSVLGSNPLSADQLDLPAASHEGTDAPGHETLKEFRERAERGYIENVLRNCDWNFTAAARVLGIQRTWLHEKAAQLGVRRP